MEFVNKATEINEPTWKLVQYTRNIDNVATFSCFGLQVIGQFLMGIPPIMSADFYGFSSVGLLTYSRL
jgi:hypothetical protein